MEENIVYQGKICWFSNVRGFGFIEYQIDNVPQKDLFLHYSDISMEGYKTVQKGQLVSFKIGLNHRNQPKAIEVMPISK